MSDEGGDLGLRLSLVSQGIRLLILTVEQSSCRGWRAILELNLLFKRVVDNHGRVLPIVSRSMIIINAKQKVLRVDFIIYVITEVLVVIHVDISLEIWFLICHGIGIHVKIIFFLAIEF